MVSDSDGSNQGPFLLVIICNYDVVTIFQNIYAIANPENNNVSANKMISNYLM